MYGFKIFIFLWVLVGAIFCLYALSTDKIKVLVIEQLADILGSAIAMMCAMIASPYWLIVGIIKVLFGKR